MMIYPSDPSPTPRSAGLLASPDEMSTLSLLWRSVLGQAIKDIYAGTPGERLDVIRWIKTPDFVEVCDHACVAPDTMREQMANLLAMPKELAKKYGKPLMHCVMSGVRSGE